MNLLPETYTDPVHNEIARAVNILIRINTKNDSGCVPVPPTPPLPEKLEYRYENENDKLMNRSPMAASDWNMHETINQIIDYLNSLKK